MRRELLASAVALLLSACATLPGSRPDQRRAEALWAAQRSELETISSFSLQGRIGASGTLGFKADLQWLQHDDGSFDLRLSGPFGAGAVAISGTENLVQVQTSKGSTTTADPEGWFRERMGWSFPVAGLRWWVLGLPSPRSAAQLEVDAAGLPQSLNQEGWQLSFTEYQNVAGHVLPRRFEASNGEVKIKVIVDRWSDLPPPSP